MFREKSSFAALSPSCVVSDGTVYVALKCYFDGSQKHGRQLTLAAVAGDEAAWARLELDWRNFLASQNLTYTHMKEAIARKDAFEGWDKPRRDWFINGLIAFFNLHRSENPGRLHAFTFSVDLKAHMELAEAHGLPTPARMCVRSLVPRVVDWYLGFPDKILDVMEFYFDRGEPFMQHIWDDWNSEILRAVQPAWGLIRTIAPVEMKLTPGIQVADMFAWSRTHVNKQRPNDRFFGSALMLCHPSEADHWYFDREKLLRGAE